MSGNWMGLILKFVIQWLIVGFWHYPDIFLDNLCDMASNISIILDMIEYCKNMYVDLLSLSIARSYGEKNKWSNKLVIHSRLFQSQPSLKKASHKKDLSWLHLHHPSQHHHFISLCILVLCRVFLELEGLWIQRLDKPFKFL